MPKKPRKQADHSSSRGLNIPLSFGKAVEGLLAVKREKTESSKKKSRKK